MLTEADIPAALSLSTLAGWNQTAADWKRLLDLDRESCRAIEADGMVVATATLTCYEDQLAWLGMVLTHPDYRNRGFGRLLVESCLELAASRKIRSVKLDATELGQPIYRSLGFREEQQIERWAGPGITSSATTPSGSLTQQHVSLDREAFGEDRTKVLNTFGDSAFVTEDGFAFWRSGARASYFGPCVARSEGSAKRLIESCLSTCGGSWYWDLLPSNASAVRIAQNLNFRVERRLARMVKGPDTAGKDFMVYAAGGFELG